MPIYQYEQKGNKTKGEQLVDFFSVAGKYHDFKSENNQDALLYRENGKYYAMVLADGVSTCAHSREGAMIACETVIGFLLEQSERLFCMDERDIANSIVQNVRYHLEKKVEEYHNSIDDYSSTLACVLIDNMNNRMLYFSVGDSLITATKNDNCYVVAMPSDSRNGCCVTTSFNAFSMSKVGIIDIGDISSVMISSDGAWHLMYRRNRMQQDIKDTIVKHEYDKLKEMLLEKERFDDCSFVAMDLRAFRKRSKSA